MATEISLNSRVEISKDVLFQELNGESVLLNLSTGVYLGLNQVGTRIWELLQADGALSTVMAKLLDEYDVAEETLSKDLLSLVSQMETQGLLSDAG